MHGQECDYEMDIVKVPMLESLPSVSVRFGGDDDDELRESPMAVETYKRIKYFAGYFDGGADRPIIETYMVAEELSAEEFVGLIKAWRDHGPGR